MPTLCAHEKIDGCGQQHAHGGGNQQPKYLKGKFGRKIHLSLLSLRLLMIQVCKISENIKTTYNFANLRRETAVHPKQDYRRLLLAVFASFCVREHTVHAHPPRRRPRVCALSRHHSGFAAQPQLPGSGFDRLHQCLADADDRLRITTVPEPGLWTVTLGFAVIIVSICYRRMCFRRTPQPKIQP